jgi:hypothetical protein
MYITDKNMSFWNDFQPEKLLRCLSTAFFMMTWCLGLVIGCSKTVASHAHILYSSTGVYILLISLFTCKVVHKFEIIGYLIFVIGLFVALSDPLAEKHGGESQPLQGGLIAFVGAGFGAVAGILSQKNCQIFHPITLFTQMFFFIMVIQLIAYPFLQDNPMYFSLDQNFGAFGWITKMENIIYLETVVVPITNIMSNIGLFKCFEYWPIEIVSITFLLEPFVTEFMAVMLGQDEIPGVHTLIGLVIIGIGLFLASYGAKEKVKIEFVLKKNESISMYNEENEMRPI